MGRGRTEHFIYGLYEGNNLVFSGTRKDIIKKFYLRTDFNIAGYITSNIRFKRKYDVKIVGVVPKEEKPPKPKKPTKESVAEVKRRESIENNLLMIKEHGNTITVEEYLEDALAFIKEHGYDVEVRRVEGTFIGRGNHTPYYVLERI